MARPSIYDPDKAKEAIEKAFNHGQGLAYAARELGVARSTIYKWMDEDPELSDAFERAKDMSLAWWHERVTEAAISGTGNAALFKLQLVNKFPDDYRDRRELDMNATIGVHEVTVDFTGYDEDEE